MKMQRFRLCMIVLVSSAVGCGAQLGTPSELTGSGGAATGSDVPSGPSGPSGSGDDGNSPVDGPDAGMTPPPPTPLDPCCHDRAHCVAATDLPAAGQTFLDNDSCDDGQLCVPDQLLDHDPISTCSANSYALGDYTGVCLSDCLHFGAANLALEHGDCDSHELCVPCSVGGQPTGAPGCP
ncbi:MAG: hypothetical protein ABI467_09280 [Kofleriaceae bacterium]